MMRTATTTLVAVTLAFLTGCSTSQMELRQTLRDSPHRQLALIPLVPAPGQPPMAAEATEALERRLNRMGFQVDEMNPLRPGQRRPSRAILATARRRGQGAVLTGQILEASLNTESHPDRYEFKDVPPPRCCRDAVHPCQEQPMTQDDLLGMMVNACLGSHERVLVERASEKNHAIFAVQLRLVDVQSGATLWEGTERQEQQTLEDASTRALASLTSRMAGRLVEHNRVIRTADRSKL